MSWQSYVDTNLLGTGSINEASIIGVQGGIWATSAGLELSDAEQAKLLQAHSQPEAVQASGLVIGGVKYFCLQANDRSIYLKKGLDGAVVVKTTQAILCCVYRAPTLAGTATNIVEGLADYLISVGY
ncbi:profilin [Lentinula boryana]|uniref:Profilin n=1 Tax=Lentinula boryana TaxID=40481 RepID=A0ABQ8QTC6_9AGAR|nr:profilin [Lentinula boryana]